MEYEYFYTNREVWLTGFARYDKLYNKPKRIITFMPTWRLWLCGDRIDPHSGVKKLTSGFKESSFFKFYDTLLNDSRLIAAAEKYQYQLVWLPHPEFQPWIKEFSIHPAFKAYGYNCPQSYRNVFAESDLIITDYSSAVFDFAYLRKPVIYAQFDKELFYSHHYAPGYFSFEEDGFGEVEYNLDSTIERIIEYMQNDCQLKDKYRKRIDNFFTFQDQNNCQRIFEKIIAQQSLKEGKK